MNLDNLMSTAYCKAYTAIEPGQTLNWVGHPHRKLPEPVAVVVVAKMPDGILKRSSEISGLVAELHGIVRNDAVTLVPPGEKVCVKFPSQKFNFSLGMPGLVIRFPEGQTEEGDPEFTYVWTSATRFAKD